MRWIGSGQVGLAAGLAAGLVLAGCEAVPPAPLAPAAPAVPGPGAAPGAAFEPPDLTREGAQVIVLELRNGTDEPMVALTRIEAGEPGPNLLPAGRAIPPGGVWPIRVSPGLYRLAGRMQAGGPLAPARIVQRNVQVPAMPPGGGARMTVILR